MPGPVLPSQKSSLSQIVPSWLQPENASVFDPPWRSAMREAVRLVGKLTGLDDPQTAILATANPAELANSEASWAMEQIGKKLPRLAKAIKAYHGSPANFEQFDASKIGSGEGAAAYGHGLYFAENPSVAADYRRSLARPTMDDPVWRYNGEPVAVGTEHWPLARALDLAGPKPENETVAEYLAKRIDQIEKHGEYVDKAYGGDAGAMYRHNAETLRRVDPEQLTHHKPGTTYEVAIHADPEHLLDWDKPLENQSAHVQQALASLGMKPEPIAWSWQPHLVTEADRAARTFGPAAYPGMWTVVQKDASGNIQYHGGQFFQSEWTAAQNASARQGVSLTSKRDKGEALYRDLQSRLGDKGKASEQLAGAGVPGIQYLDQGSRLYGDAEQLVQTHGSREAALEVAQKRLRQASFGSTGDMSYWDAVVQKLQTPETRNYVVFPGNEYLIEILKKYGLFLPAGAGALYEAQKTGAQSAFAPPGDQ